MSIKKVFPTSLAQNPAPVLEKGQDWKDSHRDQVEKIMGVFFEVLPSNYYSQTMGPSYTLQFQALAEQIASVQLSAQEIFHDNSFDYTRSEFLFQILGLFVFPEPEKGIPNIDGDITYREFLTKMINLLLQGSTKASVEAGVKLVVTGSTVEVLEKSILGRDTENSDWSWDDQFEFEVNISGTSFPTNPIVTQQNVDKILQALKPSHTLYQYRHVFNETFSSLFTATHDWVYEEFKYEDYRKYWGGLQKISGTTGEVLTDRFFFLDTSRDFSNLSIPGTLTILSGGNAGTYKISQILTLPVGDDSTSRSYTTSPTGLTGKVTIANGVLTDTNQNFVTAIEGEVLTITEGPNVGSYRLKTLVGGGPVGFTSGTFTQVLLAPSLLKLSSRIPTVASSQSYEITLDRLGVKTAKSVIDEDVSLQFIL